MSDAAPKEKPEVINDGWGSRKSQIVTGAMAATFIAATAGWLWLDKMTAAEWTGFLQVFFPAMFLIFSGANVYEKRIGQ